uniref:Uncharacterized protein n=1 Tax=Lepeophtheirus salmonis TaxID=72036 RepID=A0A0K2UTA9_LEPSM
MDKRMSLIPNTGIITIGTLFETYSIYFCCLRSCAAIEIRKASSHGY